jgi:hypothetical protein
VRHVSAIPAMVCTAALVSAGCVQIDYGISLDEDLSGTSELELTIDIDRVAYATAAAQAAFTDDGGPPTEEQIEEARDGLLAQIESARDDFDEQELRKEIENDLPEGMSVLYARQERTGLKQRVEVGFSFDHVDRLREMQVADDEDGGELGFGNSAPFEGLEIAQEGDEIIVRNEPIDPIEDVASGGMLSDAIVETLLGDLRVTFRLESPFQVLEHNATRVEDRTLIWVFDYERLRSDEPGGIFARLKR